MKSLISLLFLVCCSPAHAQTYFNPITVKGSVTATQFNGPLVGNASTATSASTATTAGNVTGTVAVANGGTGQTSASTAFNALSPLIAIGDIVLGTGVNTSGRLSIGGSGQVLSVSGASLAWSGPVVFQATSPVGTPTTSGALVYPTVNFDTNSAYNSTSGIYTCPKVGYVKAHATLLVTGTLASSADTILQISHNSVPVRLNLVYASGNNTGGLPNDVSVLINCASTSDTISVQEAVNGTGPSYYQNAAGANIFEVEFIK